MTDATEAEREEVEIPRVSPGEMLIEGREAASMSRARVASELGMTESAVREIEENNFEKFAAGIYVRGYLKNYAKLLGLDEQELMDNYDQYCIATGLAERENRVSGRAMTAEDRRRILVGCVIGVAVLAGIGLLIWLANL